MRTKFPSNLGRELKILFCRREKKVWNMRQCKLKNISYLTRMRCVVNSGMCAVREPHLFVPLVKLWAGSSYVTEASVRLSLNPSISIFDKTKQYDNTNLWLSNLGILELTLYSVTPFKHRRSQRTQARSESHSFVSSVRSSSVHHELLHTRGHCSKFVKFGAILPINIHNSLSLSFSVLYTEQNQTILLHELHWQRMHVQIS